MRGLAIERYCQPKDYTILNDLVVPSITNPDDILVKVAASSFNPIDVKFASGMVKMMVKASFPYKIGLDVSGIVVAAGSNVKDLKVGDAVWSKVPLEHRGTCAEYCVADARTTTRKPENLDCGQAASVPLVALTALECLSWADQTLEGGLKGKTVLIPAGMGGTGNVAIQLALRHFGVGKVITTLSTGKLALAKEFFDETGGSLEYIDYTKEDIFKKIPAASVDCLFDNLAVFSKYSSFLKTGSCIVSISGLPSGDDIKGSVPSFPTVMKWGLNAVHSVFSFRFSAVGIKYRYIFMKETQEMMQELKKLAESGVIKPLIGKRVPLDNLEEIRTELQKIHDGKGPLGKFVVDVCDPKA